MIKPRLTGGNSPCAECGMLVEIGEFHPYLACLAFKACHDSATVRANLRRVMLWPYKEEHYTSMAARPCNCVGRFNGGRYHSFGCHMVNDQWDSFFKLGVR